MAPRALHISKFSWGGPPNPPQGEVSTHKYSHHRISKPPFTNPIYTHVITAYKYEFDKSMLVCAKKKIIK